MLKKVETNRDGDWESYIGAMGIACRSVGEPESRGDGRRGRREEGKTGGGEDGRTGRREDWKTGGLEDGRTGRREDRRI